MLVQALFAKVLILFMLYGLWRVKKSECVKKVKKFGDGARMEILADWGNNKSHVFIAEQIDGKTHFIDPQQKAISVTITLRKQNISCSSN